MVLRRQQHACSKILTQTLRVTRNHSMAARMGYTRRAARLLSIAVKKIKVRRPLSHASNNAALNLALHPSDYPGVPCLRPHCRRAPEILAIPLAHLMPIVPVRFVNTILNIQKCFPAQICRCCRITVQLDRIARRMVHLY